MSNKKNRDKWEDFKNFLHNELGITRSDIREWVDEAVKDEAKRMVAHEFSKFNVESTVKQMILSNRNYFDSDKRLNSDIIKEISVILAESISINIKKQ